LILFFIDSTKKGSIRDKKRISFKVLPGRPDVSADPSDFDRGEKFNPEIGFDPNSFSRMDKFDGLEVGQALIDSELDRSKPTSESTDTKEK
jgi:hypothetical protein